VAARKSVKRHCILMKPWLHEVIAVDPTKTLAHRIRSTT